MKIPVCDISGMGGREFGSYEWGCQVACARALRFLNQVKDSGQFPQFYGYENIVGLLVANNQVAKDLDQYILQHEKLREFGLTGAMHQFSVQHAIKIHELGREEYLRQLREVREAESFYEFEEDDAFPEKETICQ